MRIERELMRGVGPVAVLKLLETLFSEDLAYQNPPRTFNDQTAFGNDQIAFSFRPSSSRPYYELVKEGLEGWRIAPVPQADPARHRSKWRH